MRNLEKAAKKVEDPSILTDSWEDIIHDPQIQIVIELIGGIEPAKTYILEALRAGKHVVTANKDLIAAEGKILMDTAGEYGRDFFHEAAVAGGIPIIRPLKQCLAGNHISEVMGIVNGTTNFILTKMSQEGMEFSDALKLAQELGYAQKVSRRLHPRIFSMQKRWDGQSNCWAWQKIHRMVLKRGYTPCSLIAAILWQR